MTLKIQKKDGPDFAADLEQLKVLASKKPSKQRTVLAGQLFMCSLEPLQPIEGVVAQAPRPTARKKPWERAAKSTLNLALDKEAVNMLVRARIKPVFAIDALLRYGQKLTSIEDAIVISAVPATSNALVTVLHFKKGVLTAYTEHVLTHPSSHTYEADLHVLLERLRMGHMSAVFHWCGPLSMPRSQTFINAHPQVWQLAPVQTVTKTGRAKFLPKHGLSVLIVLLAAAGYGAALFLPYQEYQRAAQELASENSRLQGEYTFASERLALLEARQGFFQSSGEAPKRLQQFEAVLAALGSVDKLVLKEAYLATTPGAALPGGSAGYSPDFELSIELPKAEDQTALEQSQPLLRELSDVLGMNLRLAVNAGFRDAATGPNDSAPKRVYRIQGEFGRAP